METDPLKRLDDWQALCDWLEDRPYNASYHVRCRGEYLLSKFYPARYTINGIPNPEYQAERKRAQHYSMIVHERSRLQLVYWASGYGWRLQKDYQKKIDAERERLLREGP